MVNGHGTPCVKDLNYVILGGTYTHLFDVVDKGDHGRKRKVLSAAFALRNLERWEFKVAATTKRLLDAMDRHRTAPLGPGQHVPDRVDVNFDFGKWINLWTIEAINNITLSASMDLLDKGTDIVTARKPDGTLYKAPCRHAQNETSRAQATFIWDYGHYFILEKSSKLVPKWRRVWQNAAPWNDVVYHRAAVRLQLYMNGEELDDFFSSLMEDKSGRPNNLEWGVIVAEVSAIINAGADTTAIALTQVLALLLQHSQHLQTLRNEVDSVLYQGEIVAPYDKVKNLPFLRACLDEGLRLIPPTSAGLPRRTPPEGASILGDWIPGDTSVSMTIYGAHRLPEIFPEPEEYQPQRWLDPETPRRMEPYFIPFPAGARGCIGRNITYLEQVVVLATLVHRYEFELSSLEWKLRRHEAFNLIVGEMPINIWQRDLGTANPVG